MLLIKKRIIALLIPLLFVSMASGQNPVVDSLETLLRKHVQTDTVRANLLNHLAYEIRNQDPQKAKAYARQSWDLSSQLGYFKGKAASMWVTGITTVYNDKKAALDNFRGALKIAEEIGDMEGQCNYLIAIGIVKKLMGDAKASDEAYERALRTARQIKDKRLISKVLFGIAGNLIRGGQPIEAIRQLQEIIKISEEIDYKEMLARAYADMGLIHSLQGNYPIGLEYYLSALEINEKRHDYIGTYDCLSNIADIQSEHNDFDEALETIGKAQRLSVQNRDSMRISSCFTTFGSIYRRMNRPEALEYFQKSLSMSKFNKLPHNISNLTNIGSIYTDRGEFKKAMENFNEASALARKAGIKRILGEVYAKMGVVYLEQGAYTQAKEYIQKALTIAIETRSVIIQRDCHKVLSEIQAATGDFKGAYTGYIQYKLLSDSLFNEKNTRKIALLESSYKFAKEKEAYETEKATRELRIRSQRQAIVSLAVISLLILLLSFAVYWSGRLKKKVLRLEIENINRELEANQKAMAVAKLKLVQNSERDAQTVKMLQEIGKSTDETGQISLNLLVNDYKQHSCHSNWEEFETLFTKVNTSFWNKLNEQYPTLTPNERKLCVFLKQNMTSKDIGLITLQSEEALKKSRLRLRKKFDLDRSTNLTAFIQNL